VIGAPIAAPPAVETLLGALFADARLIRRVDDFRHFGALPEPLREGPRVGAAALHAEGQGIDSAQG